MNTRLRHAVAVCALGLSGVARTSALASAQASATKPVIGQGKRWVVPPHARREA